LYQELRTLDHSYPRPIGLGTMPRRDDTVPPEIEGKVMDRVVRRASAWANLQELEAAPARSGTIGNDEIANGVRWIRS
jgi:hypothetical protein